MADRATWERRVAEWKASGLSSPAFCAGKGFTAGALRLWSYRLRTGSPAPAAAPRLARVVRISELKSPARREPRPSGAAVGLVVEVGAARVVVRPGFDRATLVAVVEALAAVAGSAR